MAEIDDLLAKMKKKDAEVIEVVDEKEVERTNRRKYLKSLMGRRK